MIDKSTTKNNKISTPRKLPAIRYQALLLLSVQVLKAGNGPGDEPKLRITIIGTITEHNIIHTLCSIEVHLKAILFSQELQSFVFYS